MSYTLHITRKKDWTDSQPIIEEKEWLRVVAEDKELKMSGENTVSFKDVDKPIPLVLWTDPNAERVRVVGMYLYHGDIHINHGEKSIFEKLKQIAQKLNAKVQGDEGEVY
jgi:alpha-amylase/alpha-mannosidase (GH57 family)